MNDTGWDKIVDAIDAKYGITKHGRGKVPLEDRLDLEQAVAYICFEKDGKSYKIERIERPAIVDQKSFYHKAARGGIRHENVYDTEATTHKTNFYVDQDGEWVAIEPDELV